MDSVTSGSENGSSLPLLRGTLSGKILSWAKNMVFLSCELACGRGEFCAKWQQKLFLSVR